MSRSPKLSLSFWFYDQNFYAFHISHSCYMLWPFILPYSITVIIFDEVYKL